MVSGYRIGIDFEITWSACDDSLKEDRLYLFLDVLPIGFPPQYGPSCPKIPAAARHALARIPTSG